MVLKIKNSATPAKPVYPTEPTTPKSVAELVNAKPITVTPLVKEKDAAAILCVSVSYLQQDRWKAKQEGTPPAIPFIKMKSGHVRYHVDDLQRVIDASRVG